MLRLFLDTNILVSATFWEGASYKIIMQIIEKRVLGFTTNEIMQEYRIVLKRDFQLNEEEADARVERFLEALVLVSPSQRLEIIKEDETDNRVLEGAVEARVDCIVSYDHHLADLREFNGIRILKPENILEML